MEEKDTVFTYLNRLFSTFGIEVLIFIFLSLMIGEKTEGYSTLFSLGKEGLTIPTLAQLLLLAFMITLFRFLFLTDKIISDLSVVVRNILFFVATLIAVVLMVIIFEWFPATDIEAWIGFVVSWAVCTSAGAVITRLRERKENAMMEEALKKYNEVKRQEKEI